jgi:hypothetical protein
VSLLLRLPLARLLRTRRAWLSVVMWSGFAALAAIVAKRGGAAHGADHTLLGAFGAIALPLVVYGVVAAVLGGEGLGRAGRSLVVLGAPPARVARAMLLVAVVASAILGAALAAAVAGLAHSTGDPPLMRDLVVSVKVSALGGAAYAAFFLWGASFGARGFGRSVFLVLDWVFGVGRGSSAIFTPRAHLQSLLGGPSPLDVSTRTSYVALLAILVVSSALAVRRAARSEWKLPG